MVLIMITGVGLLVGLHILGAGFDTRAYRPPINMRVRSFEVDLPKTQAIKREVLPSPPVIIDEFNGGHYFGICRCSCGSRLLTNQP